MLISRAPNSLMLSSGRSRQTLDFELSDLVLCDSLRWKASYLSSTAFLELRCTSLPGRAKTALRSLRTSGPSAVTSFTSFTFSTFSLSSLARVPSDLRNASLLAATVEAVATGPSFLSTDTVGSSLLGSNLTETAPTRPLRLASVVSPVLSAGGSFSPAVLAGGIAHTSDLLPSVLASNTELLDVDALDWAPKSEHPEAFLEKKVAL
mmetsp:Transcript_12818/g.39412  ORF Transcript_12818/g.39412 Transcript_12818/m.39412 type:complete len:207 (-) Transcript_12818:207-827(-)